MISTLFSNPILFVISILGLLVAIAIHEAAHAFMAERLGDPTPRLQGRTTLNPLAHLDPIGTVLILFTGFGWGKPVEFDAFNLKNPRKDAALISIVGPLSNFVLAILCSLILYTITFLNQASFLTIGYLILVPVIQMNLVLGLFNLLPIHPLDGFKIVGGILPEDQAAKWYELQRFGFIFLIVLIIPFGGSSLLSTLLNPLIGFCMGILVPGGF